MDVSAVLGGRSGSTISLNVGKFVVSLDLVPPRLSVHHRDDVQEPRRVLLESVFLFCGDHAFTMLFGVLQLFRESHLFVRPSARMTLRRDTGMNAMHCNALTPLRPRTFKIIDHDFYLTSSQTIDSFSSDTTSAREPTAVLRGTIPTTYAKHAIPYSMTFESPSENQLRFTVTLSDPEGMFTKVFLTLASEKDERIFGFGEQLTHFDLKGHKVPIMVREDGVGRGLEPVTTVTNTIFGPNAGGDAVSAYKPVPHLMTTRLRSIFLEVDDYSMFDLTHPRRIVVKVAAPQVIGRLIRGTSPLQLVEEYTGYSGRMEPLPEWVLKGAVAGIQGGEEKVMAIVRKCKEACVPIAALWLQDWCGKREQKVMGRVLKRLWWNWESDDVLYPNWTHFVNQLEEECIHTLTYVNSFLADVECGGKPSFRRNLYAEAVKHNYLVLDHTGEKPLAINSGPNFRAGLVDLMNPDAFAWLRDVMVKEVFQEEGVKGYMSDFAEFLPPGATLSSGRKATAADHNHYAELWSKLQKEALEAVGVKDKVVFHRSGFTKSPGLTRLFWTGDQLVSWDGYDGIKAGLVGLLSSGLSGFSLNHSDVGGYSGLTFEVMGMKLGHWRSPELLLRWMELGAFGTIFRTHEVTLTHMRKCVELFASLSDYKRRLMDEAAAWGYPLIRHMFLHFHEDPAVYSLNRQFLLGSSVLVAPVMDPGVSDVEVYLPKLPTEGARWFDARNLKPVDVTAYPARIKARAPLGKPAVFVTEEAVEDKALAPFFAYWKAMAPVNIGAFSGGEFKVSTI
ncbi:hypothetical protein HK101_011093 [Irineochytrium annulatum]|nr:hypothetical protein HK101_011093 [Irineochytrium annulatum]